MNPEGIKSIMQQLKAHDILGRPTEFPGSAMLLKHRMAAQMPVCVYKYMAFRLSQRGVGPMSGVGC